MAIQFSVGVRNGRLDSIETTIGTTPILRIRSGGPPTNAAATDTGDVLATMTLPSDWMSAASSGSKERLGTWQDTSADDTGVAGHFRIYDSSGTTCHIQGTITATGGGGDMELDNTSLATGQQVTVSTFTLTDGNA
jgi:hypothetical protein